MKVKIKIKQKTGIKAHIISLFFFNFRFRLKAFKILNIDKMKCDLINESLIKI